MDYPNLPKTGFKRVSQILAPAGPIDGAFGVIGLRRETFQTANAIREVIKEAFTRGGLPKQELQAQ